jgi:hypothetical protein
MVYAFPNQVFALNMVRLALPLANPLKAEEQLPTAVVNMV